MENIRSHLTFVSLHCPTENDRKRFQVFSVNSRISMFNAQSESHVAQCRHSLEVIHHSFTSNDTGMVVSNVPNYVKKDFESLFTLFMGDSYFNNIYIYDFKFLSPFSTVQFLLFQI